MDPILNVSRARRRNPLITLVALSLAVAASASAVPAAGPDSVYAGMPEPEAYAAPTTQSQAATLASDATYTLSSTFVRFKAGNHTLFRFNVDSGSLLRKKTVYFSTAKKFSAANRLRTFSGASYTKLTSGAHSGWWARAAGTTPASATAFSAARQVRLAKGTHTGIRFYSNMRVSLRRSATLAGAATYDVGKKSTIGSATYFFVTSGPLANRWVRKSSTVSLVSQSTADSTAPSLTPATWKAIVMIYRETDVTFTRSDGSSYRLRATMSNSMYDLTKTTYNKFLSSARSWSDGYSRIETTFVDVPNPLRSIDQLSNGSYFVSPKAVRPDMDKYAPPGAYDSIFVIFVHKDSKGVKIPMGGWGLTLPPGSWANGAGFSSIHTPSEAWWWTERTNAEEVFVHEWMHQVIFFNEYAGRLKLDLHAGTQYGYKASSSGSWKTWLSDVMTGRIRDGSKYLGVDYPMWRAGVPTNP